MSCNRCRARRASALAVALRDAAAEEAVGAAVVVRSRAAAADRAAAEDADAGVGADDRTERPCRLDALDSRRYPRCTADDVDRRPVTTEQDEITRRRRRATRSATSRRPEARALHGSARAQPIDNGPLRVGRKALPAKTSPACIALVCCLPGADEWFGGGEEGLAGADHRGSHQRRTDRGSASGARSRPARRCRTGWRSACCRRRSAARPVRCISSAVVRAAIAARAAERRRKDQQLSAPCESDGSPQRGRRRPA